MKPPYIGQCVCGLTQYQVAETPLTVYACHCTDCQKRSGSAFGLSMWVRRSTLEVTKGEASAFSTTPADGRKRDYWSCGHCNTRLWGQARNPDILVVRAGTLHDTSWLRPVAHLWMRSAQPWFVLPPTATRYETQPEDMRELAALWRKSQEPQGPADAA